MEEYIFFIKDDEVFLELSDFCEAEQYANENNADAFECGYDTFRKCWWCEEWYPDLGFENNLCDRCFAALKSRGEI